MNRFAWTILGMCLASIPALAGEVRIISIDGRFLNGPPGTIEVWPGQVVSLVADEVFRDRNGELDYAYRPVEDFLWLARDGSSEVCDPRTDCRRNTRFEVTDYGVNYYVSRSGPSVIRIEVRAREGGGSDSIVLRRIDRNGFLEDRLDGLGWWTWIGGERVFVPYVYVVGWSPYTRGYWYWTVHGWTWYSYDPWGFVTDHYGHWRHHRVYGWVWIPDPLWIWRPAVVTFFFVGNFVGWWPYDAGWHHGYRRGYAHGYDDGYWAGYWAGRRDGRRDGRRHHGAVMVRHGDFYTPGPHPSPPARRERGSSAGGEPVDLSRRLVNDPVEVDRVLESAVRQGAVGPVPGGGKDPAAGRAFIARMTGIEPQEVPLRKVSFGKGREERQAFEPVRPLFEAPTAYRDLARDIRQRLVDEGPGRGGIRTSLSESVVRTTTRPEGVRPDRGVAIPPTQVGEDRQVLRRWIPRNLQGEDGETGRAGLWREVRPGPTRPERFETQGREDVERTPLVPDAGPGRIRSDSEDRGRRVREGFVHPDEIEESPWRGAPSPGMGREVPERSVPRPAEVRPQGTEGSAPRPSEWRRTVPERPVPRPTEAHPEGTEGSAPRPSEWRRTVPERPAPRVPETRPEPPDRTDNHSRLTAPSLRAVPAPSSGSSSAPPPAYVPPRLRDSGRSMPGRSGSFRR